MLADGFFKVYRSLIDHPIYQQCPDSVLRVWLACLAKANWKPSKWYDGHQQIELRAGAFVFGQESFAKLCRVSRQQLRTALEHLKNMRCITMVTTSQYSLLVVENWDTYQSMDVQPNQVDNQQITNGQPAINQRITTEEEVKKLRREEAPRRPEPLRLARPLDEWVELLYARHPKKKDKGLVGIALLSVLEKAIDPESLIVEIDRRHGLWAKTNEWTERNGRFVPSLAQWIEDHGWTQRPDTELPPPRRWVAED